MKLSIIASHGIPAKYVGHEVFAEQLAIQLAKNMSQYVVSCALIDLIHLGSHSIDLFHYLFGNASNLCAFAMPGFLTN